MIYSKRGHARLGPARLGHPANPVIGHNRGPRLEPEWGTAPIDKYFIWKNAHNNVWKNIPYETAIRRVKKAASLGLTYQEYTLEILERGRFLQADDTKIIAQILSKRLAH